MGSSSSILKIKGSETAFHYSDYFVAIETILDIKNGWKISTRVPNYPLEEKVTGFILGVLGSDNNLKAKIINRFCKFPGKLPANIDLNSLDTSKGLKVRMTRKIVKKKYKKGENPNPNRLVCLFSGNQDTPIQYTQNEMVMKFMNKKADFKDGLTETGKSETLDIKRYEEIKSMILNDKIITERFIDEYILETCNCILILLKDVKFKDQRYVEDILRKYKDKKRIFIVHHLQKETSILGVKQFIELKLKSLFLIRETFLDLTKWFDLKDIQEHFYNKSIFVQQDVNENLSLINEEERTRVVHLVLAMEGSIAGKSYNTPTYKYMEEHLTQSILGSATFNLASSFENFLSQKFNNYFYISKKPTEKEKSIPVKIILKNNFPFLCPELSQNIKVNFFEKLSFNILGEPFPLERKDYIPYRVLEKTSKVDIFLDIPYLIKNTINIVLNQDDSNFQYLIVTGVKEKSKSNQDNEISVDVVNEVLIEKGTALHGPFEMKIPLAAHNLRFKKKIVSIYKNGILNVTLRKTMKEFRSIPVVYYEKEVGSKDNLLLSNFDQIQEKTLSLRNLEEDRNKSVSSQIHDFLKSDSKSKERQETGEFDILIISGNVRKNNINHTDEEANISENEKISEEMDADRIRNIEHYKVDSGFKAGFANREGGLGESEEIHPLHKKEFAPKEFVAVEEKEAKETQ